MDDMTPTPNRQEAPAMTFTRPSTKTGTYHSIRLAACGTCGAAYTHDRCAGCNLPVCPGCTVQPSGLCPGTHVVVR